MAILNSNYHRKFELCEITIRHPVITFESDSLRLSEDDRMNLNIYHTLCQSQFLQSELNGILELHNLTLNSLNFKSNLVPHILESHRQFCVSCYAPTSIKSRTTGCTAIKYAGKQGPIMCVSYTRECVGCATTYYHNKYVNGTGDEFYETVDNCIQQNSRSTFVDDSIIDECVSFMTKGVSVSAYAEIWNDKFEEEIDAIDSYLLSTGQSIPGRKSCGLCENRLNEAIFHRQMHIAIEYDLKEPVVLEKALIDDYRKNNKTKLLSKGNDQDKISNNSTLNAMDYFCIMHMKYGHLLKRASLDWMK
eukprot:114350_1